MKYIYIFAFLWIWHWSNMGHKIHSAFLYIEYSMMWINNSEQVSDLVSSELPVY